MRGREVSFAELDNGKGGFAWGSIWKIVELSWQVEFYALASQMGRCLQSDVDLEWQLPGLGVATARHLWHASSYVAGVRQLSC